MHWLQIAVSRPPATTTAIATSAIVVAPQRAVPITETEDFSVIKFGNRCSLRSKEVRLDYSIDSPCRSYDGSSF